ncbi:hypothetical protein Ccrd_006492, partial [Cynara cardunculus var. scolymus]
MGFILIRFSSTTDMRLNGAILQIISPGFIGAALFFFARTRLGWTTPCSRTSFEMSQIHFFDVYYGHSRSL